MGSIDRFQGQVSVLNYKMLNGEHGPTYRCLFPKPPAPETALSCDQIGVLGVLPAIIGSMQAAEVIKIICGIGEVLSGKLLVFDALKNKSYSYKISRNEHQVKEALKREHDLQNFDYNDFCHEVPAVSAEQLFDFFEQRKKMQLIDVREKKEIDFVIPGSDSIPIQTLNEKLQKMHTNGDAIIVYCDYGITSKKAVEILKSSGKFKKVFNLEGGIDAWLNVQQEKK